MSGECVCVVDSGLTRSDNVGLYCRGVVLRDERKRGGVSVRDWPYDLLTIEQLSLKMVDNLLQDALFCICQNGGWNSIGHIHKEPIAISLENPFATYHEKKLGFACCMLKYPIHYIL